MSFLKLDSNSNRFKDYQKNWPKHHEQRQQIKKKNPSPQKKNPQKIKNSQKD